MARKSHKGVLSWTALALLTGSTLATTVSAALLGRNFVISPPGCRFPDAAFGSVDSKYLVVWPDYTTGRIFGRLVTASGSVSGEPFPISEASGLYPAVAYNAASNHFLVTWDDAGDRGAVIFGQRVRGSDGTLIGSNFAIGSRYGGIRSAVAWSPLSRCYLVVYWGPAPIDIYAQRVSGSGQLLGTNFNISNDAIFSGYPAVALGSDNNQFLVTWDNEDGNIHGRRIDAATGALLGSTILVNTGGGKDRSCVAYDSVNHRWLVQYNNGANAGYSYDQYGQLVNPDGTLYGGPFPIAHTPAFEGDTQFGGDVAFVPMAQRFFSSFGTDTGMGGQESFVNGSPVGGQLVLGTGYFTSLNNAADPQRNRFLTTWEGLVGGSWYVFGQLCAASVNPVTDFAAVAQDSQNVLSWRNPGDGHFTGTMIRVKTSGYPTGPEDGELVADKALGPGENDSFLHTNLANWINYYYAAFAHDVGPNYSVATQAAATPRHAVVTISSSDFTSGPDSWTLETWRAGTLGYGTVAWDAAGNIVSTGNGISNNRDTCTREGSIMTKLISTAGRQSIQVEYDVMAALALRPSGSLSGTCPVLDNSDEDKLVVFYSISGTNGPWNVAQVLNEGVELPTAWTRKLINLAGVPTVNNNPNFALRFQWQFNSAGDTGRVDHISVLSGAVTAPRPAISLSPARFERTIQAGQNYPGDVLRVGNSGEGTLVFNVSANVPWLNASPASGNSAGPERRVLATYNTAGLPVGDYDALIQITSAQAINSPKTIRVTLHINPPSCFWEPFDFYDGNLTLMGAANWSGTASNELQVQNGILKIFGGSGAVSASHTLNCAGSNGFLGAHIKVKKGAGSGDFFWNIAFDDPAGNNVARWYGGSTIARGRVGGSITADIPLSGLGVWDDLYLKLDTAANTSEFFFNGVSFGAISHGATASNVLDSIRLERLDRASAMNDEISFDNLSIGALDTTPPRLTWTRVDNTVVLSWAAERMGAALECITDFTPVNQWITVTGGIAVTNARNTFTVVATNSSSFYRLRLQ